jgi:hypothetical protein
MLAEEEPHNQGSTFFVDFSYTQDLSSWFCFLFFFGSGEFIVRFTAEVKEIVFFCDHSMKAILRRRILEAVFNLPQREIERQGYFLFYFELIESFFLNGLKGEKGKKRIS